MKIYVITEIHSNVCSVNSFVYSDYDKAIEKWNKLSSEHKEEIQRLEEESESEDIPNEEIKELHSDHKHISYDNGEYGLKSAVDIETDEEVL